MRTKVLKIDGKDVESMLMAGGPGFKIYTASGIDGWIVVQGKTVHVIGKDSPEYKIVGRYANLKYHKISDQAAIKKEFDDLVTKLKGMDMKEATDKEMAKFDAMVNKADELRSGHEEVMTSPEEREKLAKKIDAKAYKFLKSIKDKKPKHEDVMSPQDAEHPDGPFKDIGEKEVSEFEIEDIGMEHSQYFTGRGVSHSKFDEVSTGIGLTQKEAGEDALEMLAQGGWKISEPMNAEVEKMDDDYTVATEIYIMFKLGKKDVKVHPDTTGEGPAVIDGTGSKEVVSAEIIDAHAELCPKKDMTILVNDRDEDTVSVVGTSVNTEDLVVDMIQALKDEGYTIPESVSKELEQEGLRMNDSEHYYHVAIYVKGAEVKEDASAEKVGEKEGATKVKKIRGGVLFKNKDGKFFSVDDAGFRTMKVFDDEKSAEKYAAQHEGKKLAEAHEGYNFTDKESQKKALGEFIDDNAKWQYEYETQHEDSGNNYLDAMMSSINSENCLRINMSSNDLWEPIESAKEAGLTEEEIDEILKSLVKPEASGVFYPSNTVFSTGQLGEIEVQLSGMGGNVNGKEVDDAFEALIAGLSEEDLKDVAKHLNEAYWDPTGRHGRSEVNDLVYANADYDTWMFVVDPEEFAKAINEKLKEKGKEPIAFESKKLSVEHNGKSYGLNEAGEADGDYDVKAYNAIGKALFRKGFKATHKEFDKYQGVVMDVTKGGKQVGKLWTTDYFVTGKTKPNNAKYRKAKLVDADGEYSANKGDYFQKPKGYIFKDTELVLTLKNGEEETIHEPTIEQLPDLLDVSNTIEYEGTPSDVFVMQNELNGEEAEITVSPEGKADVSQLVTILSGPSKPPKKSKKEDISETSKAEIKKVVAGLKEKHGPEVSDWDVSEDGKVSLLDADGKVLTTITTGELDDIWNEANGIKISRFKDIKEDDEKKLMDLAYADLHQSEYGKAHKHDMVDDDKRVSHHLALAAHHHAAGRHELSAGHKIWAKKLKDGTFDPMQEETESKRKFMNYLAGTLIPDLNKSGFEATAQDFRTLVMFLAGKKEADGFDKASFVDYLTGTLIPDLDRSGKTETAKDFRKGVALLGMTEASSKWTIFDWAGNVMFGGQAFKSFEDAEEFLSGKLGDDYETDRGEYEISQAGARDAQYLDPKQGGQKKVESKVKTDEEYIQIAKDHLGTAVRDNSKEELIAIGKKVDDGSFEESLKEGEDQEVNRIAFELASSIAKKEGLEGEAIGALRDEIEESLDSEGGRYSHEGKAGKFEADGVEYNYIESEDEAERIAKDYVKEMLDSEPETFSQDFLQSHIYISPTDRRIIAVEESDHAEENLRDDLSHDRYEDIFKQTEKFEDEYEALQEKLDNEEDKEKAEAIESEIQKLAEKVIEEYGAEYADRVEKELEDPIQYFVHDHGIYSVEDLMKANFISIDTEAAAEDAVSTDGWAHFLSTYDGNYETTQGGIVYFRE